MMGKQNVKSNDVTVALLNLKYGLIKMCDSINIFQRMSSSSHIPCAYDVMEKESANFSDVTQVTLPITCDALCKNMNLACMPGV